MSKRPYVIQKDSPNLVIVPTDTCYEPLPKKPKLHSDVSTIKLPTPTKNYDNSVFATKTGAKLNLSVPSTNNDSLIDVRKVKKSPPSWASNFLQSIGGSSQKLSRLYSSAPKTACLRKENTKPDSNKEINLPKVSRKTHEIKTNTVTINPIIIMDKKGCLPKKPPINLNLINPQNISKHAHKPITPQETSQPNCTKNNASKSGTSNNQAHVKKLPSLPKNYKIPIHTKCSKPAIQPVTDKEITESSNVTNLAEINSDITETQYITNYFQLKPNAHPDKIINKEITCIHPKDDTKNIQSSTDQNEVRLKSSKSTKEINYDKEIDLFLSKVNKVKEFKAQTKSDKHAIKPKCDVTIVQTPKTATYIAQAKKNKEIKEPKGKENKKRKVINESELPKSYRNPLPEKCNDEMKSLKTNADIACSKHIKDISKIKNKKETTYSTKLKTKKEPIQVKSKKTSDVNDTNKSKRSKQTRPKNHSGQSKTDNEIKGKSNNPIKKTLKTPPQLPSKAEDFSSKLQKERVSENNTIEAEYTDSEIKQQIRSDNNITKKELTKLIEGERSSKSISPIKSIVTKIKSDVNNSPESRYHKQLEHLEKTSYKELDYHPPNSEADLHRDPKPDLRSKLKRKINKRYFRNEDNRDHRDIKNKFARMPNAERFVPKDNLIISFDAKNSIETNEEKNIEKQSPVKKMGRKQPPGRKKCKKIKLEINIVFDHADTTDEECVKSENEGNDETLENSDLSFLDDFNVDEIVKSLNEIHSNSEANLTLNDIQAQDLPSSCNKKLEAVADSQNSALVTQFDNNSKTLHDKNPSVCTKKNNCQEHQAMQLKAASENRPYHQDIIESKINPSNAVVKKVMDTNQSVKIEGTDELMQHKTSKDDKKCSFTSEIIMIKSKNISRPDPMNTSQDNETNSMRLTDSNVSIQADKHIMFCNNTKQNTDKHRNKNSTSVIKTDCPKAKHIVKTNAMDPMEVLNIETNLNSVHEVTEPSASIGAESDVIIIDDSESENETKIRKIQSDAEKSAGTLMHVAERPTGIISDDTTIDPTAMAGNETILILDTDYDIEESIKLTGCEVNTKEIHMDDQVKQDVTVNDSTVERTNNLCTESKSESEVTSIDSRIATKYRNTPIEGEKETNDESKCVVEMQHGINEKEKISDNNSKTSGQNLNLKSSETNTIISEKCMSESETISVSAAEHSANKTQNKTNAQANIENEDKESNSDSKPKTKENCSLNNDKLVRKLGCRLLDITGERYTITDLLHVGKFSKIYICKDQRRWNYAVKLIKNKQDGFYLGLQKQNMLMKLQNGVPQQNLNCVRFFEGFTVYDHWCFLMEFYPKNLQEALAENKECFHIDLVQILSRQLVSAVTILRNNNIIHSDIKPSHVLINASTTRLKLCGFDQSSYFDGSRMLPNTGTCNYRAPELILGYPAGYGIDVWSTALVMFEMATNKKLFPGIFNNDILYKQLCTVGSISMEMLMSSMYKDMHFRGTSFTRIIDASRRKVVLEEIRRNDRINNILFKAYARDWSKKTNQAGVREDKAKLCAFSKLLHSMLTMHPRYRIAIEFVFANPFIYETFDN